jgi:hypothetical protein
MVQVVSHSLAEQTPGFDSIQVSMGFMKDEMALKQASFSVI